MNLADLLAELLSVAAALSGYEPIPVSALPPVEVVEPANLANEACPMEAGRCGGIVAYFDTDRRRILLSTRLDLDNVGDNSFVVHELVHVLEQHYNGGKAFVGCEANLRSDKKLNPETPLNVYWIRYAEQGQREEDEVDRDAGHELFGA